MRASTTLLLVAFAGAVLNLPPPPDLAAQTPPTPRRITRLGSSKAYGPGVIGASIGQVWFELTRPAHVIVLRVDPNGSIEAFAPQGSGPPSERTPGVYTVEAPPPERRIEAARQPDPVRLLDPTVRSSDALARGGRSVFPPAAGSNDSADAATTHYWLVIAADSATSIEELQAALEVMRARAFTSVEAAVRALPRGVITKRARSWAASYALVQR
jgi:hypothetical protein